MDVLSSYNPLYVTQTLASPMRTSLSLLRSLSLRRHGIVFLPHPLTTVPVGIATKPRQLLLSSTFISASAASQSTFVEQVKNSNYSTSEEEKFEEFEFEKNIITEGNSIEYDIEVAGSEMKRLDKPVLEVKELEELPELWRRSKLAWLCKEVPVQKARTFDRLLNAQKKWLKQEDATYLAVHCMRIRENDAAFRVYKWMMQQHWYRFDFALATKLADYMGRERKFSKCRETFDDIINQGRVPSESTFHILIIAYLSAPVQGCLDEACSIYNRMIQLGGYQPSLSLHNSLFKALVSKPGGSSKHYLKQAEFIFHNLVTTGLKIQKDIYSGLIWLHSYQDTVDKERITKLREEMRKAGIEEGKEVLLSQLRVCAKEGDVEEAERIWLKLQDCENVIPTQAFVYKMEAYAENGNFMKSLDIFREMQNVLGFATVPAYHKIIEVLCDAQETEFAESLMKEFVGSGMKPLMPSYINLTSMYLNLGLHDRLHMAFFECLGNCRPNRNIYNIYLESLIKVGDLEKAEDAFNKMQADQTVGINTRSCNIVLSGYLSSGDYVKAEKIYDLMCQKKYDIEPPLMEKLDYVLSLTRKEVKKPMSLKLKKEQREILVGLLLGGLRIESDEQRKKHMLRFEFNENSSMHFVLRGHLYDEYHEWLHPSSKPMESNEDVPFRFATISHSYFGFYADQFWPKGKLVIPKLIHRWLSPRALAYWFMFSGHRTSVGDILLKVKGNHDGVEKVVKAFNAKSLECRVKRKGKVFWIGFLGSNSTWFWKLIEPYVLEDIKEDLITKNGGGDNDDTVYRSRDTQDINFDSASDSEVKDYDNSDDENS